MKNKPDINKIITNKNYSELEDLLSKNEFFDIYNIGKNWKLPKTATGEPRTKPDKPERKFPSDKDKRKYILEPLDEVILNPALLDDILVRCAVPDLLEGREPSYSGVILFGPPGTGKTVLQRALVEVYERAGAHSSDKSLSQINSCFVGQFAQNLEDVLETALQQAKARKKPSFISFDEGSTLVQTAEDGAASVSKHYQEAIDVLKKYIGNYRELVLSVSTNLLPESFEDALTREGRLTSFLIDYPQKEERMRLWQHFSRKYGISDNLNQEQLNALAEATPAEQGAFVEEFCRNYMGYTRAKLLKARGYSTLLDALREGKDLPEKEIKEAIDYETLFEDLKYVLQRKLERNGKSTEQKQPIGFNN